MPPSVSSAQIDRRTPIFASAVGGLQQSAQFLKKCIMAFYCQFIFSLSYSCRLFFAFVEWCVSDDAAVLTPLRTSESDGATDNSSPRRKRAQNRRSVEEKLVLTQKSLTSAADDSAL